MDPEPPAIVIKCDVGAAPCDAATVDVLAHLCLLARRLGGELRVSGAGEELRALVWLMGLTETLGLEPGRQPEQWEQGLGVEEESELDDPAA
jgi:anti-anti-sigma regulatory factor